MSNLWQKGERPVGRAPGTPNKRTVEVRSVIEGAARAIGGMARLVEWIKEDPANERLFWSTIYIKLLPMQVMGMGVHGEIEVDVKLSAEEMQRELAARNLPMTVFGTDKPVLQIEGNGALTLDDEQSDETSRRREA